MYDSVTASDIPAGAVMVAGYVDLWSAQDWARFPDAVKVSIARFANVNAGTVLDVEPGCATPEQAPGWITMRRMRGVDPTIYCTAADWSAVAAACDRQNVPRPHLWVAAWNNTPDVPAGAVAHQYANPTTSGGHYDLSAVLDFWPGVDRTPPPPPPPTPPQERDEMILEVQDGAKKVYVVSAGGKRWIQSPRELDAWFRSGVHVEPILEAEIAGIPTIPGAPG